MVAAVKQLLEETYHAGPGAEVERAATPTDDLPLVEGDRKSEAAHGDDLRRRLDDVGANDATTICSIREDEDLEDQEDQQYHDQNTSNPWIMAKMVASSRPPRPPIAQQNRRRSPLRDMTNSTLNRPDLTYHPTTQLPTPDASSSP